ncbi:unnamed protein product, partial [Laminaria digitata]
EEGSAASAVPPPPPPLGAAGEGGSFVLTSKITDANWSDGSLEPEDNDDADFDDDFAAVDDDNDVTMSMSSPKRQKID